MKEIRMPFLDHRQNSTTEQHSNTTDSLQFSGLDAQQAPVEQLSFPDNPAMSGNLTPLPSATTDSNTALATQAQSPLVTRELPEVKTDAFSTSSLQPITTTLRQPVLIRGTGRKSTSLRPPESRRHPVKHAVVAVVLALVVLSALFAVVPLGSNGQSSLFKSIIGAPNGQMNINSVKSDSYASIAPQQAATATAVTQDGVDPGNMTFAGVPTAPPSISDMPGATGSSGSTGSVGSTGSTSGAVGLGTSGFNRFFYGQCTYWANMRYYELTGYQTAWIGDADQWAAGAAASPGWVVSTIPHVPSIIVLQPGEQGAGEAGHVAVVESIPSPGVVHTSNWNWYANGGFGILSYWNFNYPAAGTLFIWHV
jgi:surface antigen